MAEYRIIALENGQYAVGKVSGNRVTLFPPSYRMMLVARCESLDDILPESDFEVVRVAHPNSMGKTWLT